MFEHHRQPLISKERFLRRVVQFAVFAFLLVIISWLIGILGYRYLEGMGWLDAMLNSAMILGGMGPVNALHTSAGKIFASFYALFSGIIFLVSVAVLLAPIIHRLFHKFYLQAEDHNSDNQ